MPASARSTVALGLLLAAGPLQTVAGEAPRFDPAQFVVADTGRAPLRPDGAPTIDPSHRDTIIARIFADAPTGAVSFEPNFDRRRTEWMRQKPPPPVVFREPFPRRRSVQDSRREEFAVVVRSTLP